MRRLPGHPWPWHQGVLIAAHGFETGSRVCEVCFKVLRSAKRERELLDAWRKATDAAAKAALA